MTLPFHVFVIEFIDSLMLINVIFVLKIDVL